jgi:hypothetical protein
VLNPLRNSQEAQSGRISHVQPRSRQAEEGYASEHFPLEGIQVAACDLHVIVGLQILFVISARLGGISLGKGCELLLTQAESPHLPVFHSNILDRIAIKYDLNVGPAQACNPFVVDRFALRRRTCPEMGECAWHDQVGIVDNYSFEGEERAQ